MQMYVNPCLLQEPDRLLDILAQCFHSSLEFLEGLTDKTREVNEGFTEYYISVVLNYCGTITRDGNS